MHPPWAQFPPQTSLPGLRSSDFYFGRLSSTAKRTLPFSVVPTIKNSPTPCLKPRGHLPRPPLRLSHALFSKPIPLTSPPLLRSYPCPTLGKAPPGAENLWPVITGLLASIFISFQNILHGPESYRAVEQLCLMERLRVCVG